jgi:sterol desaturase/sphingolipid hydroxylase (fatty acid hydroxylase superfamily)
VAALCRFHGIGGWPLAVQVVVLYLGTDFIYYWVHRGIHRWPWLWRASGHGVHHAFHRLHAAHAGLTHPFEFVLLAAPMTLWVIFAGPAPDAVLMATVLLLSNSMLAHCNLRMATPVLRWFLTTSEQHRRHHSAVFIESNSNYACNAILWDRLFGTYGGGTTAATGIGPRQPSVWELLRMPFREPDDSETVANQRRD